MNIITEKEIKTRLEDGIDTILSLNEEEFQSFIDGMQVKYDKNIETIKLYYATDKCVKYQICQ